MSDRFVVPGNNLVEISTWVAQHLGLNINYSRLSEHQMSAQLHMEMSGSNNYRSVLKAVSESVGVITRFDEFGALQLVGIDHQRPADHSVTYDDIRKVSVASELEELTGIILNYSYDYSESEYAGILFAENVNHHYPHGWGQKQSFNTLLIDHDEAMYELERRASRRFVRRRLYSIDCYIQGVLFRTGDRLHVCHPLWGLDNVGTIWDVDRLPGTNTITLEVEI